MFLGLALALAVAYFGYLRDSSFVAVEKVTVTGLTTREAPAMRTAITEAALAMTTLHVREGELQAVLDRYPVVRSVRATADFPDRLRVHVVERTPVAAVVVGTAAPVAVSADATVLRGVRAVGSLARVTTDRPPSGERLADRRATMLVRALGAAPAPLVARAGRVHLDAERGIVVSLRRGPEVVVGDSQALAAKWTAAARVLATDGAKGASYVDVRLPERPVAGGVGPPSEAESGESGPPGAAPEAAAARGAMPGALENGDSPPAGQP
jgi:cell division protein FtsQ